MVLDEFLSRVTARGVTLSTNGDRLRISAPPGAIDDELRSELESRRGDLLELLRQHEEVDRRRNTRIEPVDRSHPLVASYAQRRLWMIEQLASDVPIYNMYICRWLRGELDPQALRQAVRALTERHEVLRTSFVADGAELFQVVHDGMAPWYVEHDVRSWSAEERDALIHDIVATRFDLAAAPLIRFDLLHTEAREWILIVTQHHVISDGWSASLLRKELSELYSAALEGREAALPEVTIQYADFAAWERTWMSSGLAQRQREFWREHLTGLPPTLELTPARSRSASQSYRGAGHVFRYSAELTSAVDQLCRECGTTVYGALVAAYGLLLSRLAGIEDVPVGSPVASRPYPALENTFGLFFNSVTMRLRPRADSTVREYIAETRRTAFEAFAHQDLPFDQVVQAVAPDRSASHSPVFQAMFILQSYPESDLQLTGLETGPASAPVYATQYDLMFKLRPDADGAAGFIVYDTALFDAADIERIVEWFRHVLEQMVADPDQQLSEISLTTAKDQSAVDSWNEATRCAVDDRPIHRQILEALQHRDEEPVLTFRGTSMTGRALRARARTVSEALVARGLQPGSPVGVLLHRSEDLVAALLGILDAGLSYVPLDISAPAARSRLSLEQAHCSVLLTSGLVPPLEGFSGESVHIDTLADDRGQASVPFTPRVPAPEDTAYVIFTSGSSGVPKGVVVSHGNLTNFFAAMDRAVPLPDKATWLAVTNVTFDIAVVELLWALTRGARVVLNENADSLLRTTSTESPVTVPELMDAQGIDVMQATPTFVRSLLRMPGGPEAIARLEVLLVGGESLTPELASRLRGLGVPAVLNMYGPTETTVWSTVWRLDEQDEVLVGRPVANTTVHVVDAQLRPLPVGAFGELLIGGAGVAQGYVASPELTAERFVNAQWLDGGRTVYRTGDLARFTQDGELQLVGRMDNQVKVDGYRIELEEIERAIDARPEVVESAVTVQQHDGRSVLAAHCVLQAGAPADWDALRGALTAVLPPQMVPALFRTAASLPVSPSGKLARNQLPSIEPVSRAPITRLPADALEEQLLAAWCRVLGESQLGVDDDFFRRGGNSLLVVLLLEEVRRIAPQVRLADLFQYPTVRALASKLGGLSVPPPAPDTRREPDAMTLEVRARRRAQIERKREARRVADEQAG